MTLLVVQSHKQTENDFEAWCFKQYIVCPYAVHIRMFHAYLVYSFIYLLNGLAFSNVPWNLYSFDSRLRKKHDWNWLFPCSLPLVAFVNENRSMIYCMCMWMWMCWVWFMVHPFMVYIRCIYEMLSNMQCYWFSFNLLHIRTDDIESNCDSKNEFLVFTAKILCFPSSAMRILILWWINDL